MLINNIFEYTSLERVTNPDGTRYYTCPVTSSPLASVTTILSATNEKKELKEWIARVGEEKAEKERKEASGLGSLMHEHLECHIQGIARPRGNNLVRQMASRMADVIVGEGLCHVSEVYGFEVPLYYPGIYAGTSDLIGVYKGKPAIIDYKTAKVIKKREKIGDYLAQGSAYAEAHNRLYGTDIRTIVIFMVSRDLKFQSFVVEPDEYDEIALGWAQRVESYLAS